MLAVAQARPKKDRATSSYEQQCYIYYKRYARGKKKQQLRRGLRMDDGQFPDLVCKQEQATPITTEYRSPYQQLRITLQSEPPALTDCLLQTGEGRGSEVYWRYVVR